MKTVLDQHHMPVRRKSGSKRKVPRSVDDPQGLFEQMQQRRCLKFDDPPRKGRAIVAVYVQGATAGGCHPPQPSPRGRKRASKLRLRTTACRAMLDYYDRRELERQRSGGARTNRRSVTARSTDQSHTRATDGVHL